MATATIYRLRDRTAINPTPLFQPHLSSRADPNSEVGITKAASLLGVPVATVRRLVEEGHIPAGENDAGRLTFRQGDLAGFVQHDLASVRVPLPVDAEDDRDERASGAQLAGNPRRELA